MSALTKYGFVLFIGLYGLYQISNANMVPGLLGIAVALALLLLFRRT